MKVAIIGGNSRVASEVCFLLRQDGVDVIPIVRTQVGASFLEESGFDCRIADVTHPKKAENVLVDADVVVLAAFARQYSRRLFHPKQARSTNESLVRNTVKYSPSDATVIYFSSIKAWGNRAGFSEWDEYTRENRNAENILFEQSSNTDYYSFRMGVVMGKNQTATHEIEHYIRNSSELHLKTEADKLSNSLHTTTIKDAIIECRRESWPQNKYTLVNEPRWTWRDVFEYHTPAGKSLNFYGNNNATGGSTVSRVAQRGLRFLEDHEAKLRSATVYLPDRINSRIYNEYVKRFVGRDIEGFKDRSKFYIKEFDQKPAPGPLPPELPDTSTSLKESEFEKEIFEPKVRVGGYRRPAVER
jgi:dTDP-4-dehydrorhamnose reductase